MASPTTAILGEPSSLPGDESAVSPTDPLTQLITPDDTSTDDETVVPYLLEMLQVEEQRCEFLLNTIIPLGAALGYETDFNHLLERVLVSAIDISRAEAGALYLCAEDGQLRPSLLRRNGVNTWAAVGVLSTTPPATAHTDGNGKIEPAGDSDPGERTAPGLQHAKIHKLDAGPTSAARRAAASGHPVAESGLNSPAPLAEYASFNVESAMGVPLRDPGGCVIGVIELCNARRDGEPRPVPFEVGVQRMIEALSLLAAVALKSSLREAKLREQVQQLKVEIDNAKKHRQVSAIVESDYFRDLQARARDLRAAASKPAPHNNQQTNQTELPPT